LAISERERGRKKGDIPVTGKPWLALAVFSLFAWGADALAEEATKGLEETACRSVHLAFPAAEGVAFYNEVTVDKSARGTYFMVCGWHLGYCGIQEYADGKKVVLFSVWDGVAARKVLGMPDDPKAIPEEHRVKVVHRHPKVKIARFGGEGTGGQAIYSFDWKAGQTYRIMVTAAVRGARTEYAGYLYNPGQKRWEHLVTFSTIAEGALLRGYYSFIEDFLRNGVSRTQARQARFGNGWVKTKEGEWVPLTKARFTADRNPATTINACLVGDRFLLATGGNTRNTGASLGGTMDIPDEEGRTPPTDLPGGTGKAP
jgi:hypothetical protein